MLRTRRWRAALVGSGLVCLVVTTGGQAVARWNTHDSSGTVTDLAGPPGGAWWETCSDELEGRTGWMARTVEGQDPQVPDSARTPVAYEVLKQVPGAPSEQVATFTTAARTDLPSPQPMGDPQEIVYTAAPFDVRLTDIRPGDGLMLKPFPGVAGPVAIRLTAVDCGDPGFFAEWEDNLDFCTHVGDRFLMGRLNRDGRADVLCQSPATGALAVGLARAGGRFDGADWKGRAGRCGSASRLLLGDVDGDGRDDVLCHDPASATLRVALVRGGGRFAHPDQQRGALCLGSTSRLLLDDVNGDRRSDLVCHQPMTGRVTVALAGARGRFAQVDWRGTVAPCSGGAELRLDRANRDARADVVCLDPSTGAMAVAFARAGGHFPVVDRTSSPGVCAAARTQALLADITGDGRTDVVCHDTASGYVWLVPARAGARYRVVGWQRNLGFCPAPTGRLEAADVSGDGRADLVCHEPSAGRVHIAYSDL